MLKIRRKVFETNSSSTHSLTKCRKDEWDDFLKGNLYYNVLSSKYFKGKEFITEKEYQSFIEENKNNRHEMIWLPILFLKIDDLEKYIVLDDGEEVEAELHYYFG